MDTIKEILRGKLFYVVLLGCLLVVAVSGFFVKSGIDKSLISLESHKTEQLTTEYLLTETEFPKIVYEEEIDGEDVLAFNNLAEVLDAHELVEEASRANVDAITEETTVAEAISEETSAELPKAPKKKVSSAEEAWPVDSSDIVMDFSIDKTIYDKTLDQYRTNDLISIKAPAGTQVKAYKEGIVKEIGKNEVMGNYIVIEHTDGLITTYGQLQDNILVKNDTEVAAGQVIGGVSTPSKYSILLGEHLDFRMTKDGEPIDPKVALAAIK